MEFALWFGGVCLENLVRVSDASLAKWVGGQEGRPPWPGHTYLPRKTPWPGPHPPA